MSTEVWCCLIFGFGWFVTLIWGMFYYNRTKELKGAFSTMILHNNHTLALYVMIARQNRELVTRYNSFKNAVRDTFFIGFMTTQDVIDFYKKCGVPQGDAKEDESNKGIVQKTLKNGRDKTNYWKAIFK